jgi:uncharacterized membrane protein YuzA (DUF378 family)
MFEDFELYAWVYIVLKVIVIIGALNWGLIAINPQYDIFELISSISHNPDLTKKIIFAVISLSAVYILLQRKTYLPFLDISIAPISRFLKESKQKDFELELVIDAKGGEKVLYWAADKKSNEDTPDTTTPNEAYNDYDNSGISIVDKEGKAKLYVKCPKKYFVMYNKILPQHLHYRVITKGILGPIKTINLSC